MTVTSYTKRLYPKGSVLLMIALAFALAASPAFAQDLVNLSIQEQKRRASLKIRSRVVITNANIKSMKTQSAAYIQVAEKQAPAELITETKTSVRINPSDNAVIVPKYMKTAENDGDPTALPKKTNNSADEPRAPAPGRNNQTPSPDDLWAKAKEQVELLTLKMNYLKHEFSSMDDMMSRDNLLQQMDETLKKLDSAKKEEAVLRKNIRNRK